MPIDIVKNNREDKMNNIKAIAVDIDGTITDSHRRLCASAMNALRKAEDLGIPCIIVTGNVVNFAYGCEVLIGTSGGVVCENGGGIFKENVNNNQVTYFGDLDEVKKAHKYLMENIDSKYTIMPSHDNEYRLAERVYYKTLDKSVIEDLVKGFNVKVYDSGFAIHITNPDINKGYGLKKLLEYSNIDLSQVMAIGDGENDMEFLSPCGLKIAVANADNELKEIADYVCKNKYGDGVAEAIDKFILNKHR